MTMACNMYRMQCQQSLPWCEQPLACASSNLQALHKTALARVVITCTTSTTTTGLFAEAAGRVVNDIRHNSSQARAQSFQRQHSEARARLFDVLASDAIAALAPLVAPGLLGALAAAEVFVRRALLILLLSLLGLGHAHGLLEAVDLRLNLHALPTSHCIRNTTAE
jgi:hypothetical protein